MTFALDSTIIIDLERGDKSTIKSIENLKEKYQGLPIITFISYFEFFEGILKKSPKNKEESLNFLNKFFYLDTTKRTAEILAELKTKYEKMGANIALADLIIAAQVKENNLILVTKDNHFARIEEINKIIIN